MGDVADSAEAQAGRRLDEHHVVEPPATAIVALCARCRFSTTDAYGGWTPSHRHRPLPDEVPLVDTWLTAHSPPAEECAAIDLASDGLLIDGSPS